MRPDALGPRRIPPRDLLRPFLFAAVGYLVLATLIGLVLAVSWLSGGSPPFGLRLAHVHLAMVGGASIAMLGSIPFFGVALLATVPPKPGIVNLEWWLANLGTLALGVGFYANWSALQLAGGILVFVAVALAGWTIYPMLRRSLVGLRIDVVYYCAAFVLGLLGMLLGLLLITGVAASWLPREGLRLAHLHLTLVGWVSLTIFGTMHTFYPTILGSGASGARSFVATFWLLVGGVLALAAGLLWLEAVAILGAVAILAAALLFGIDVIRLRLRRPGQGGLAAAHLFAATLYFLLVVLAGTLLLAWRTGGRDINALWLVAYAHLGLVGWIVQTLVGAMTHLLPVLVGARVPPGATREAMQGYVDWRATMENGAGWQFWLLNGGLFLLAGSLIASSRIGVWPWLAFLGGLAMLAALVVFASKAARLFAALRRAG